MNIDDLKSQLSNSNEKTADDELKSSPAEVSFADRIAAEKQKMPVYIGTKVVQAAPMTQENFLKKQGKYQQGQETYGDGYIVKYEDGYESWSPKDVFERCYRLFTQQEINMVY